MKRWINTFAHAVTLAAIILPLAFGMTFSAQAQSTVVLVPGTVTVRPAMEDAVKSAIAQVPEMPEQARYFAITDVQQTGHWWFVSVIGLGRLDARLGWSIDDGAWFGLIAVEETSHGPVAAPEGTVAFSEMLARIPNDLLDPVSRQNLDPLSPARRNPAYASSNTFPWQSGTAMFYGSLGVHSNDFAGIVPGWMAVDVLSDGNTGAGHAPNRVLAVSTATISYKCTDGTSVAVKMGDFFYTHLLDNANLTTTKTFNRGDEMGQMKTGTFSANCGWANQGAGWFHLHWGFPNTDQYIENWTLSMSTRNWTNGGTTVTPGNGWITAGLGGSCALTSIPSGYSQCANEGGTCSFSGTADVIYGANSCFTSPRSFSNGTACTNDVFGDPLAGVGKFCYTNGSSGSSWAYQIFDLGDYNGSKYESNQTVTNLTDVGWNDRAQSMRINSGYEIIACVDANFQGTCGRATGPAQFSDINALASGLRNGLSSVKVCAGSCPSAPGAPSLSSPGNGSSNPYNYSLTFQWNSVSNATEYLIEWWGGPYSAMQPCAWTSATSCAIGTVAAGNTYSWHVKARNGVGESGWSNTWTFTIQAQAAPSANFDAWPQSGTAPFTTAMHIVDTSNITSCSWTYGDGQTGASCASLHDHIYTAPGTYTVTLTVNGPGGTDSMTRTGYISVTGSGTGLDCGQVSYTGVILYENTICNRDTNGRTKSFAAPTNWVDIISDFNDITSSIYIAPGWSVKVFEHSVGAGGGSWRCLSGSMWDLGIDYYTNGNTGLLINNTISSVQVYQNGSCASDSTSPSVSWVSPTTEGQVYDVGDQTVQLEVTASDDVGVTKVVFYRWDYVNLQSVEIGTDYSAPYRLNFDTSVLLPDWNEIDAFAYDANNNSSGKYIWLNHQSAAPQTWRVSSLAAYDGWLRESADGSGLGGSVNARAASFTLGDDQRNRQYRSILHFDTSWLPDDAVITAANLSIKQLGSVGTNPFTTHGNIVVDIVKGAFGGAYPLIKTDFQASASLNQAGVILNTPSDGWYSTTLDSATFPFINLTGATQFRLRFEIPDNYDRGADYLTFYSGNFKFTSMRPVLEIQYYVP